MERVYYTGIDSPIGTIWAGAMMMQHLGYQQVHDILLKAITEVLKNGSALTRDMGGQASMTELTDAILAKI